MPDTIDMKIGVLAFHGAYVEHKNSLEQAFINMRHFWEDQVVLETVLVKRQKDFINLDGLILPGGESTVMSKFMARPGFMETLNQWLRGDQGPKPYVFGTCAGLILLANTVDQQKEGGQLMIGGVDITTSRNIFMRQTVCFEEPVSLLDDDLIDGVNSKSPDYPGIFINPPIITSVDSSDVQIIAERLEDGKRRPIAVRQGNLIVSSFHPELTDDYRWHEYFIKLIYQNKTKTKI